MNTLTIITYDSEKHCPKDRVAYLVIGHYPGSPFVLGDILLYSGTGNKYAPTWAPSNVVEDPGQYPNLFKENDRWDTQ